MHNDPVWDQLFTEIATIQILTSNAMQRLLPAPLSVAGYGVLDRLARQPGQPSGPWTPSRLASIFRLTGGAITNTLSRLEAAGFVTITADPGDGRARHVAITPAGLAARDAAQAALAPYMTQLIAALPRHQARAALPLLEQLRVWLDNNRAPPHSAAHD